MQVGCKALMIFVVLFRIGMAQTPFIGALSRSTFSCFNKEIQVLIPVRNAFNGSNVPLATVTSSNTSLLRIHSMSFEPPYHYILATVAPNNTATGSGTINVIVQNQTSTTSTTLGFTVSFEAPGGVYFQVRDAPFWTKSFNVAISNPTTILSGVQTPAPNQWYCDQSLTVWRRFQPQCNTCVDSITSCFKPSDGFTMGFFGYIIPTVSGTYTFAGSGAHEYNVFLADRYVNGTFVGASIRNPDSTSISWLAQNRILNQTLTGYTTTLLAGRQYALQTKNFPIFDKRFSLSIAGPGMPMRLLSANDITFSLLRRPYVSLSGVRLTSSGSTKAWIRWRQPYLSSYDYNPLVSIIGYNVYLNGIRHAYVSTSEIQLNNLEANTTYSILATYITNEGTESSFGPPLVFTTKPLDTIPPEVPTQITSQQISDYGARLSWSASTDVGTGLYKYHLSIVGISQAYIKVDTNFFTNTLTTTELQPNQTYKLMVQAIDAEGNKSISALQYTFTTTSFELNPIFRELSKSTLSISSKPLSFFDGFGIVIPPFNPDFYITNTTRGAKIRHLESLNPGLISRSNVSLNGISFADQTGPSVQVTIGDFLNTAIALNCAASLSIGVANNTDWVQNPKGTMQLFIDYIAGSTSTPGGALRASEGYEEPFLPRLKQLNVEVGYESYFGRCPECGVNHQCDVCYETPTSIILDYTFYTRFAQSVSGVVANNQAKLNNKVQVFLNTYLFSGWLNVLQTILKTDSGNFNGLNFDIGFGDQSPWVCYTCSTEYANFIAYKGTQQMLQLLFASSRIIYHQSNGFRPLYLSSGFYRASFFNSYIGANGLLDAYFSANTYGIQYPTYFELYNDTYSSSVLFDIQADRLDIRLVLASLANSLKGYHVLQQTLNSYQTYPTGYGNEVYPISAYPLNKGNLYGLLLINRDLGKTHRMRLADVNEIIGTQTITGTVIQYRPANFLDKITTPTTATIQLYTNTLIELPPYACTLITFTGNTLNYRQMPVGYTTYGKATPIKIVPKEDYSFSIITPSGVSKLNAESYSGTLQTDTTVFWNVEASDGNTLSLMRKKVLIEETDTELYIEADAPITKTTYLYIKATNRQDAYNFDTATVLISTPELLSNSNVQKITIADVLHKIYPNPSSGSVQVVAQTNADLQVFDAQGRLINALKLIKSEPTLLNLQQKGLYIVCLYYNNKKYTHKLIVE